jgi:hypothetical protein
VTIVVEADENEFEIQVHPKVAEKYLVHEVARKFALDLPGYWHPRVIFGIGNVCRYQEGDVVRLFPATEGTLEALREPHTERGSVAKTPKTFGGPHTPKPAKVSKVQRDWIGELRARGEIQEKNAQ